jgi:hypothetical protein
MAGMGTKIERTHLAPETRDAAIRVVNLESDADMLLQALGLVADPVAEERSRAKALAEMNAHKPKGRAR